jgi:hypothetical protein
MISDKKTLLNWELHRFSNILRFSIMAQVDSVSGKPLPDDAAIIAEFDPLADPVKPKAPPAVQVPTAGPPMTICWPMGLGPTAVPGSLPELLKKVLSSD